MASNVGDEPVGSYTVVVDDNYHYQDTDHRYEIKGFETFEEALEKCKSIVDSCLAECAEPGSDAETIFACYQYFGEDPWVAPGDLPFSAWDYAKENAHRFVR